MKKNNLFFILQSRVLINTVEYIYIGNSDCDIEIFNDVHSCALEAYRKPQAVVYELDASLSFDDNWKDISSLRLNLTNSIPLIIFAKNPEPLSEKVVLEGLPIRVVPQDEFFLDNLFGVISEEFTRNTVYYQM